jgi:hypothetical protein
VSLARDTLSPCDPYTHIYIIYIYIYIKYIIYISCTQFSHLLIYSCYLSCVRYYPLANLMPALAAPLVSADRTATIFVIGYDPTGMVKH